MVRGLEINKLRELAQLFLVQTRHKKRSYAGHNEYFCNAVWAKKNKLKRVGYIFLKP